MGTNDISRTSTARNIGLSENVTESLRTDDSVSSNWNTGYNVNAGSNVIGGATTGMGARKAVEVEKFVKDNGGLMDGVNFHYQDGAATPTFKTPEIMKAWYNKFINSSIPEMKQMAMDVGKAANVAATSKPTN
jgi:hypothetical protein